MLSLPKPIIFGCEGHSLTQEEKVFFEKHQPLGLILFARNIENPDQVRALIEDFKSSLKHKNPPILIDQEGGRVARLRPPFWKAYPTAKTFGDLAKSDLEKAKTETYRNFKSIAQDLKDLGISVNCAPLLDLNVDGADQIIGDRAFSRDSKIAGILGHEVIRSFQDSGITSIIKHIPTHGPADCDSHEDLPRVTMTHKELKPHFEAFKVNKNAPWAMTAHIIYEALDSLNPATHSPKVISEIIRGEIGFQGILVSDDIGMKALKGTFQDRAQKALLAGCDVVLHCSGKMDEMEDTIRGVLPLSEMTLARWEALHGAF
ncbi:Beta-N-acetylhexosaminidase [Candidatus Bealeia paramacronuclearis]|uniref:beta-N-acetylhexosaminidase n=1 Tax=Candidatus Bealeia paramacronuclearis TaxID=1921001 RepID=A0ABZ2C296_9PROT|nr:Beta-N-acetylhexosaminidase [Candidatus Bealeia paramacronuclearis]